MRSIVVILNMTSNNNYSKQILLISSLLFIIDYFYFIKYNIKCALLFINYINKNQNQNIMINKYQKILKNN